MMSNTKTIYKRSEGLAKVSDEVLSNYRIDQFAQKRQSYTQFQFDQMMDATMMSNTKSIPNFKETSETKKLQIMNSQNYLDEMLNIIKTDKYEKRVKFLKITCKSFT